MGDLTYNEFQLMDVSLIYTDGQVRKKFKEKEIEELADSINNVGLISPINVTKSGEKYKIVAGERRFRAIQLLNWESIPAIIVEGDANKLKEMQLIENCQRLDMNPVEELEAYSKLILDGYTADDISFKIGKNKQYVHSRLNLSKLTDRAKKLLFDEEINLSHCKFLCVMDEDLQEEALDTLLYTNANEETMYLPAKDFGDFFNRKQALKLSDATFDLTDANLIEGLPSCLSCPNNSDFNTLLFDGISKNPICSNTGCFMSKTEKTISNKIKELSASGIEVVEASEYYSNVYANTFEYTKISDSDLESECFEIETMLMIVEGSSNKLGTFYPVYSESQLKAIQKAKKTEQGQQSQKEAQKTESAIRRYSELVISRISESIMAKSEPVNNGISLLAIYKLYAWLGLNEKAGFIKAIIGDVDYDSNDHNQAINFFFSNLDLIEKNIGKAFSIISLLHLDRYYAFKDEPQFTLISKLASEAGVDLEKCKGEIEKESDVDLSDI